MVSEEEEEYVDEASPSAELAATYRDAETITGNVACIYYNER